VTLSFPRTYSIGGEEDEYQTRLPDPSFRFTMTEVESAGVTEAVTPSLITMPAPILPVPAGVAPPMRLKYPEICPGQNAVTVMEFMGSGDMCVVRYCRHWH
jgi:hypothetical protein